jgi:RimJ/RimL family protein N-acetyltransferase
MTQSLDTHDQQMVRRLGADHAASQFFHAARSTYRYQPDWWVVGQDADGRSVGCVQPVLFPDCQQNGLEEGTIYYIGVDPHHRGQAYSYDLLCQATATLQHVGVWRIYCDTDVQNLPMQQTFTKVGYQTTGQVREFPLEQ